MSQVIDNSFNFWESFYTPPMKFVKASPMRFILEQIQQLCCEYKNIAIKLAKLFWEFTLICTSNFAMHLMFVYFNFVGILRNTIYKLILQRIASHKTRYEQCNFENIYHIICARFIGRKWKSNSLWHIQLLIQTCFGFVHVCVFLAAYAFYIIPLPCIETPTTMDVCDGFKKMSYDCLCLTLCHCSQRLAAPTERREERERVIKSLCV